MSTKLSRCDPTALVGNVRATLSSWNQWQSIVLTAISQHPKPYIFAPAARKAPACVGKIRDAIRGAIAFGYAENSIPLAQLRSWYDSVVIRADTVNVIIGPVSKELSAVEYESAANGSTNSLSFDTLEASEVNAFAILLSGQRISGPIIIRNPKHMEEYFIPANVEMVQPGNGSVVLL